MSAVTLAAMTWAILDEVRGSPIKARRAIMRRQRWTDTQWQENWSVVGDAMEVYFRSTWRR